MSVLYTSNLSGIWSSNGKNYKLQKVNTYVIFPKSIGIIYKRLHLASFTMSQRVKTVLPCKRARITSRQWL